MGFKTEHFTIYWYSKLSVSYSKIISIKDIGILILTSSEQECFTISLLALRIVIKKKKKTQDFCQFNIKENMADGIDEWLVW